VVFKIALNSPFKMLACDYDGTIASCGAISPDAEQALIDAKQAGFLLCLITGREFEELLSVCPQIGLFDLVVAENGAVLYLPASGEIENLASPPTAEFTAELARRGVPFSKGRVIRKCGWNPRACSTALYSGSVLEYTWSMTHPRRWRHKP
jgi:hypothetical protein